jgi:hypothetical protein
MLASDIHPQDAEAGLLAVEGDALDGADEALERGAEGEGIINGLLAPGVWGLRGGRERSVLGRYRPQCADIDASGPERQDPASVGYQPRHN